VLREAYPSDVGPFGNRKPDRIKIAGLSMSNIVQGLVWNAEFPNAVAKLIAVKLADWADDFGGSIFPAVDTIAKMTSCGRSTVCKWQFAMEHCGLLKVTKRSAGGATNTSERAFDVELLRRLTPPRRGIPAELALVEATIERQITDQRGKVKTVSITVLKVVDRLTLATPSAELPLEAKGATVAPFDEELPENDQETTVHHVDGYADPATVHHVDGSEGNRPPRGRTTVHDVDSNRPPRGPKPSGNHQIELHSHSLEYAAARESVSERVASATVNKGATAAPFEGRSSPLDELRAEGGHLHVVEGFIAPLWGVLEAPKGTDALALLRAIRDELAEFSAPVLAAAARHVRGNWSAWRRPVKAREACAAAQRGLPTNVVVRPGSAAWEAWLRYWRDRGEAYSAKYWTEQGYALVPAEFPPVGQPPGEPTADMRTRASA